MLSSRRDLLQSLYATGALSAALGPRAFADSLPGSPASSLDRSAQEQEADQATYDFWSSGIRDPNTSRTRSVDGGVPRPVFVFYDKRQGFVTGSDIGDVGLPDRGDLNLLVNVDHIHLSKPDAANFLRLEGGSLRIDVQQMQPLPSLPERLAWTAFAGLLPAGKAVPAAKDMKFDPGTTWGKLQTVPLPGGGGHWTWNFFLQQRRSRWVQLFDLLRKDRSVVPVLGLGLPAIALTALETVDTIMAELTREAATKWLFQSSDMYVYGTRQARDLFEGTKLRLRQGTYVIVPSTQLASFSRQSAGLEVKDGLLVPRNTRSLDVPEASERTLTDVTYVTVGVTTRITAVSRTS